MFEDVNDSLFVGRRRAGDDPRGWSVNPHASPQFNPQGLSRRSRDIQSLSAYIDVLIFRIPDVVAMGADVSSPSHTEGKIDGRPATFYYKRGDSDEETGLAWTEGYKVCRSLSDILLPTLESHSLLTRVVL